MKIKHFLFTLVLALLPLAARAEDEAASYRLSLDECMALALKNNQEIRAKGFDIEKVLAQKIEATKRYVPVVKYKYNLAPVPGDIDHPFEAISNGDISVFNSFKIEMGAPITTFGKLTLAQSMADLGVDLSSLQKAQKSGEVALNVYKLYQGVVLARELRALGQQALDALDKNIHELEKEDTTDQIQVLKLKVVLYEVQRRVSESAMKEALALATLKVQMGLPDAADLQIKTTSLAREKFSYNSFDDILAVAQSQRPEYKLLSQGLDLRLKEIQMAKKDYLPKLVWGAFAEYGYAPGISGDNDETEFSNPFNYGRAGFGLELNGELDFRKIASKVEQAQAQYLKTGAEKTAAENGLTLDLKKDFENYKQYRYLLTRADEEKKTARQIVFLTKSNMDIGLGEEKDYYEALQSYLVFEAQSLESVFQYNTAVATLKLKMGQLYPEQGQPQF